MKQILPLIIVLSLLSLVPVVVAQEASPASESAVVEEATPVDPPTYEEEIEPILEAYRSAATTYRNQHQEYVVAKGQYQQLDTLASLEEAVFKTRQVMATRNIVLDNYLQLLEVKLRHTDNIDPTQKEDVLKHIQQARKVLVLQADKLQTVVDRRQLADQVAIAQTLQTEVMGLGAQANILISYGEMQTTQVETDAFVKTLSAELLASQAEEDTKKLLEVRIDEVELILARTRQAIDKEWEQVNRNFGSASFGQHDQLLDGLLPVYADLYRAQEYIAEIMGISYE